MSEPNDKPGPTPWHEIDGLLAAALARPPAERFAFLQAACPGDPAAAEMVASLLDLEAQAPPFLDGEAVAHALPFLARAQRLADPPGGRPGGFAPGDRVGDYRLVRELGCGGMSVVYLAERDDRRFQKQVAVKFVQPLLADSHFLRRFQDEREILARLEHPAIARILDGGETEGGIPYFVMEYVDGAPVDSYCVRRRLGIEERLALFLKIGEAVGYAHQNLVVHRDLKPTNVLVTDDGEVKLLDFGIAKVLSGPTDSITSTLTGERLMTPAFASPEQVRGEPVRTASDVYSLGVLLYVLLTGRGPYRAGSSLPEMARAVLEQEPPRPSVAVGLPAEGGPEMGESRGADIKGLRKRLRGDLDVIVMKALRKEPERRYPSVDALREDLLRHLAGEAVAARGDVWTYRLGKLARRRWAALATAAAFLTAAASFSVFYTKRIQGERDAARQEAAKASAATEFLVSLFEASDPYQPPALRAEQLTARTLLDRGADRIRRELADQPEVRAELLTALGRIHTRLGLFQPAESFLNEGLALRRQYLGPAHQDVAESLDALARLLQEKSDYKRAEPLAREAYALRLRLFGAESAPVAESLNRLGDLGRLKGDAATADASLREALRVRRRLFGEEHEAVAESLDLLGLLKSESAPNEAETLLRQAAEIRRKRLGEEHAATLESLLNLAAQLYRKGDLAGAESIYRRVLEVDRALFGPEHPRVIASLNNVALLLKAKGDLDGAEQTLRAVVRMREKALGEHIDVARALNNLATVLLAKRDLAGAEALLRRVVEMRRKLLGPNHPQVGFSLGNLATVLRDKGELEGAEATYREAWKIIPKKPEDQAYVQVGLGRTLVSLGRPQEAEPLLTDGLRTWEKLLPSSHYLVGTSKASLGSCFRAQGRYPEAERLLTEAHDTLRAVPTHDPRATEFVLRELVALSEAMRRPDRAAHYRALLPAAKKAAAP